MGSYVSITNDSKDEALTYLGPDMKVLQISLGVLSALLVAVPGVGEILSECGESVEAAVEEGFVTESEVSGATEEGLNSFKDFLKDAIEQDRAIFRNMLDNATFSFNEAGSDAIDIEAGVEGFEDLPDVPEEPRPKPGKPWTRKMITKGMVASALLEGVAQGIIRSYQKKNHNYHVVMPGQTLKSGKKSMSLLMQYNATRISHDDKVLHCWTSEHAVWSGPKNKSVNRYKLSDHHFHWKKAMTCNLKVKSKPPGNNVNQHAPEIEQNDKTIISKSACCVNQCLPKVFDCPLCLPCDKSAWAEVISDDEVEADMKKEDENALFPGSNQA